MILESETAPFSHRTLSLECVYLSKCVNLAVTVLEIFFFSIFILDCVGGSHKRKPQSSKVEH